MSKQVYYWNSADTKDHIHKRIENAISKQLLSCYNIKINDKLFDNIKIGDIILSYEPKYHKTTRKLYDGYCISCMNSRNDGMQAFTYVFEIIQKPIKLTTYLDEEIYGFENIYNTWITNNNLDQNILDHNNIEKYKEYCKDYYSKKNKKYIFPIKLLYKLETPISTNKKFAKVNQYFYKYPVIKGFDKLVNCGCNTPFICNKTTCIYNYISNSKSKSNSKN
jgi:hypothetical protein